MRRMCSVTTVVLVLLSLLLTSSCAWIDARQREIIYRPTVGSPANFKGLRSTDQRYFVRVPQVAFQNDAGLVDRSSAAQQVAMWWLPHADKNAPSLLYFHGTFRTLYENLHKMEALRQAGFSVLAVEYRGWGLSSPIIPSEQTILQDADVAWMELQRLEPRASQRVLYGHSMGSGVAVHLASRLHAKTDYGALILESAFTSFADVAHEAGFFASLLASFTNEKFASIDTIAQVHAPLLMIHGSLDTTIPIKLGKKLFAAANSPKEWCTIEGGAHSDLDQIDHAQYQAILQSFKVRYLQAL